MLTELPASDLLKTVSKSELVQHERSVSKKHNLHDIRKSKTNSQETLIFVNTLFSCLVKVSETHSFVPVC